MRKHEFEFRTNCISYLLVATNKYDALKQFEQYSGSKSFTSCTEKYEAHGFRYENNFDSSMVRHSQFRYMKDGNLPRRYRVFDENGKEVFPTGWGELRIGKSIDKTRWLLFKVRDPKPEGGFGYFELLGSFLTQKEAEAALKQAKEDLYW